MIKTIEPRFLLAPPSSVVRSVATTTNAATPMSSPATAANLYPHGMEALPQGVPAADILARLGGPEGVSTSPLTEPSAFVKPQSVFFHLDGNKRRWDMVNSHSSVAILLYHTQRRAFLLVRQFRPAVYATAMRTAAEEGQDTAANPLPLHCGFTFELCAGIVGDKPELSLVEIAREEILEETGYDIPADKIRKLTSFLSAVGISGSQQTIFYAEVDEGQRAETGAGGGGLAHHGEAIEVVALPADSVESFLMDEELGKSAGLMFALTWARQAGVFAGL